MNACEVSTAAAKRRFSDIARLYENFRVRHRIRCEQFANEPHNSGSAWQARRATHHAAPERPRKPGRGDATPPELLCVEILDVHAWPPRPVYGSSMSLRNSARAFCHSRSTVRVDCPVTSLTSTTESPAKNRISINWWSCGRACRAVQRAVNGEQALIIDRFDAGIRVQRDDCMAAAALLRLTLAYEVHDDAAHHPAHVGEESDSVSLLQRAVLDVLQEAFVHQDGGVQFPDIAVARRLLRPAASGRRTSGRRGASRCLGSAGPRCAKGR